MNKGNSDELYITYFFPPDNQVSGINVFKRIVENKRQVDVLHAKHTLGDNSNIINEYVANHITVDVDYNYDWAEFIFEFIKQGLKSINKKYDKIYSRSWLMANHFLAAEYKFQSGDVIWTAEFSDPLIYDITNKAKRYKEMIIDNKEYISKINGNIKDYNKIHSTSFDLVKNKTSAYYIAEYLVYLFADNIVFTNENQCEVMLNQFPQDIKEHISDKIIIKAHTTLPEKYYTIKDVDLDLDNDCLNIAYFGSDYYSLRHFESLFYAVDSIYHKDKIKIYLYLTDDKLIKNIIKTLNSPDCFHVKKSLDYFEFLNATTKFDILIVNDLITKNNFKINPYLPSKLSDYKGSSTNIWAFYEKGSVLSKQNLKYKSDIHDLDGCREEFLKILYEFGYLEKYYVDEDYLFKRLTSLNQLYEKEYHKNIKTKKNNTSMIKKAINKLRK